MAVGRSTPIFSTITKRGYEMCTMTERMYAYWLEAQKEAIKTYGVSLLIYFHFSSLADNTLCGRMESDKIDDDLSIYLMI